MLDLELTGLDPAADEIVSFATVTVAGGRIRLDDALHRVVRPHRMPGAETIRIHGLRRSDLAQAPHLDRVLDELLDALAGRVLVAHVAPIEEAFLRAALEPRGIALRNPVVDTARLALGLSRLRRAPTPPTGLSALARSHGLPVHRPHHADGDALTTAQLFLALATHLDGFRPMTIGSLVEISPRAGEPDARWWRRLWLRLHPKPGALA